MFKITFHISVLFLLSVSTYGEGTKEVRPLMSDSGALYIGTNGGYANFARNTSTANYRLYIKLSNVGEKLLFGLKGPTNVQYNLHKPNGTSVLNANCPNSTQTGYIADWAQAVTGPFAGGYSPLQYTVTNIADTGDYYIDFNQDCSIYFFDFQVVTGNNTPALPSDAINGRVFSKSWQFYCGGYTSTSNKFNGRVFIYSDDGIVTKLLFKSMVPGAFTIYCNPTGCANTGNFNNDRRSRNGNNAYPQYRVFLNDPDHSGTNQSPYPSGVYGIMTQQTQLVPAPPPCSGNAIIKVWVNKAGSVQISLAFPIPYITKEINANVVTGENDIPWDGKDSNGTPIPDGTPIQITIRYINGLTNLPLYDIEYNNNGFEISLIRPTGTSILSPLLYWDDTQLAPGCPAPNNINLTGCDPSASICHNWSISCGDVHTINSWWYSASTNTQSINQFHVALPPTPTALPQYRCDPGDINLNATVLPQEEVRWYDQPTGGTLLFTGSPFIVNLPANGIYHYYAEAYNPLSTCTSIIRKDVVAEAVPVPSAPAPLNPPFFTCGPGTVTMVSTNTNPGIRIDWYDDAIPPNKLGSGNSFTTPVISVNTTYYTEAVEIGSPAGCSSATRTQFVAEVRPSPALTNTQPSPICSGTTFTLPLEGSVVGSNFTWTASCMPPGAITGFTAAQTATVTTISDPLVNTTTANATVTYLITPHAGGCDGNPTGLNIIVKPTPHLTNPSPEPICGVSNFNVTLLPDVTGGDFTWTATCSPIGSVTGFTASQTTSVTAINDPLSNITAATASVTYTITPHAFGCDGPPTDFSVTLQPTPHLTNPAPAPICSETLFSEVLVPDVSGAEFTWTATSLPIGAVTGFTVTQSSPVNAINDLLINTTTGFASVIYNITPHANGCDGIPATFTVTVKPTPHLVNAAPAPICSGGTFAVTLVPDVTGGDFTWIASCNPVGSVTGFTAMQSTNTTTISDILTNTTSSPATVTYHVNPHANGCDGPSSDFTVIVNPTPHLTNTAPAPVCSGTTFGVTLVPDVTGGEFTWTATCLPPGAVTGFTAAQIVNVTTINDLLTNNTIDFATVTYQITPHANGCDGPNSNLTVTVNPTPHLTNSAPAPICSGTTFNATLVPDVTGADFTWTASCLPVGAVTGFTAIQSTHVTSISDILINTTAEFATVTYQITPHANGCDGPVSDFTVTVKPTPHLTNTQPAPVCSGTTFNLPLTSDVTGSDFTWTADCNPAGAVTGFTALQNTNVLFINDLLTNITATFATVTYQITPHANGCDGPVSNLTVTVNPTPHLVNTAPAPICSGTTFTATLIPDVTGGDFTWTASSLPVGAVTGFTAVQSTNVTSISDLLINTTTSFATVTYQITPHANGCSGSPTPFTVTVKPTPHLVNAAPAPICSQGTFAVTLVPDVTGGDFTWTASCNPAGSVTGFTAIQSANITAINDILTNTTSSPATVTYQVLPHANGCDGPPSDFTVTVNPTPHLTNTAPAPVCSGNTFAATLVPDVAGGQFTWTASCLPMGAVTGFTASQPANVTAINDILINGTAAFATVTYLITPHANGCDGPVADYTVTVKPTPHLTNSAPAPICSGTTFNANLVPDVSGGDFTWTASCLPVGAVTGFTAIQSTNVTAIGDMLINTTAAFATVTYQITPHANGCDGPVSDFTVTVKPTPHLTNTQPSPACSGTTFNLPLTSDVTGSGFTWNASCLPVGAVSGFTAIQNTNVTTINDLLTNTTITFATVTYHITPHANGCDGPASDITVTINPTPHLMNPAPGPICSGTTFSVTLIPDVTGGKFTWTASSLPFSAVTGFTVVQNTEVTSISDPLTNNTTNFATVTYIITPHANGCSGIVTNFSVTVNPKPAVIFPATPSNPQQVCSGATSTAVALSSSVVLPGVTYAWTAAAFDPVNPTTAISGFTTPNTGSTIPGENIVSSLLTQGVIKYTVTPTFTSAGVSCPGDALEYQTLVNPSPTVALTPPDPFGQNICSGSTSAPITFVPNATPTIYTWLAVENVGVAGAILSGSTDNIPAQTLTTTGPVQGHVRYQVTPIYQGGGTFTCPGGVSYSTIFVNPLPTPVITGKSLACELGPNETYSTPLVPGNSYLWTVTGGTITSSPTLNQITVTWGPYTVSPGTLIVTETIDATGCPKTTNAYSVVLQQRPIPSLAGPQSVCDGSTGKVYQTETGMANYEWSVSGGTITSGGTTGSPSATVTWTTPGAQWIQVNYVNSLGCPGFPAKQLPVTVNVLPNTTISEGPGPNCEGASHLYNVPADPLCSYVWSVTPASRGTIASGQGTNAVTIAWQTFGNDTIAVTGTNNTTTCLSSSSHLLTINPKPLPAFTACFDLTTTPNARKFNLRGASPMLAGQGVFSGNRVSLNASTGNYEFDPFGAPAGVYPVTYTFTNNFGCLNSAGPVNITVVNSNFSCGGELTDVRDGKKYNTSLVGGRCWMTQNLTYGTTVDPPTQPQTDNCINEKYCLTSDPACSAYGGLYQWDELIKYASTSASQGICPPEWHVPSEAEWQLLIDNISAGIAPPANGVAAGFLKDPLLNPGFYALMNGLYYINTNWSYTTGSLTATMYWTSTPGGPDRAVARGLNTINPSVSKYTGLRGNAFSVRCVKDN